MRDWQQAGAWDRLHQLPLAELHAGDDWQLPRAGAQGRPKTGPSPVDRAKTSSKHHMITDGHGIPLAVRLTSGNRHDVLQLIPLIEAIPPVRGKVGKPRQRPSTLYVGRAYDHDCHRRSVLTRHTNDVSSVTFSPDGETLATASNDNSVKLWPTR
ncbi:hypothetical protein FHS43_005354 [Streptosporangium becharense]|uniref:Transposase IS4-like domain-containing protein n=1 Tax=Streptosporangium becharense TaxID=1816182 RepID=A0A7W9IAG4_9ACTN|nr:transposase [Streptosporangium becharense]MBB2914042.1 hypothetical protein [Streptosporangium becharense]MBB5817069.1 hypothetical protein [Streptosporangium becharense]